MASLTRISKSNSRTRKTFSKNPGVLELPGLIDMQIKSYESFLQHEVDMDRRDDIGLQGVFKSVFPISDFNDTAQLEFVGYCLERPKYDVDECRQRGMTFAAPVKVTVRLVVWDVDEGTGTKSIRDVKEQEVFLGEIPLMTQNGSFIVNGTERVVVSQLHRSPGVFFAHDSGKTHASGKLVYSARIIPYRGSWLDFEFDHKDNLFVRIDRRRKLPVTVLLKSLGMGVEEILETYFEMETITYSKGEYFRTCNTSILQKLRPQTDVKHPKTQEVLVKKGRRFTKAVLKKLEEGKVDKIKIELDELLGKVLAYPIIDESTGEVLLDCNEEITEEILEKFSNNKVDEFKVIFFDRVTVGSYIRDTLLVDKVESKEEAILEIYKRLRPGEPPTPEAAETFFNGLFFEEGKYDLSRVGRVKINYKFTIDTDVKKTVLEPQDIILTVKHLIGLKNGEGDVDDIDHLGNRRVRSVGELLENQFRMGLVRMERAIKERMSLHEIETLMPHDLINAKPVSAAVKEFFGSSQLSQFMDQTNPLSEITHKRRLSALGPGGLTRDRAGFEVRDVHATHYGRICPIETPEGPNIGLISSLSAYGQINPYGFIETPYREVMSGKVTKEIKYFSALEEEGFNIAQANTSLNADGTFAEELVTTRLNGEVKVVPKEEVQLMDVSPSQLVSIAASLIPFLEHDDANRALMGSNMQRQAVPLLRTASPLVGTGMEGVVARDSGTSAVAKHDGVVDYVDANRIVVRRYAGTGELGANVDIYNLVKYQRSNQNTCINQKPTVYKGDILSKGDVIADGPGTEKGELALGQNITVALMPWQGYNFEDAILISERLIREDVYTSIHIEEFECVARDTKLGKEEVTRDIPNVGEEALSDLDSSGIVRIGAEVKPGDILVGKVTPKGETQLSPEEKLLRAIFGEKAGDVRDTSLRVPSGITGTVIDAQIFSREGTDRDERSQQILEDKLEALASNQEIENNIIRINAVDKMKSILVGQSTTGVLLSEDGSEKLLNKGIEITAADLERTPFNLLAYIPLRSDLEEEVARVIDAAKYQMETVKVLFSEKIERLKRGDELAPGVIKMVKVYVAIKRPLAVGDKMAGRHGNKGVISKILPIEDMPYLPDGTPVDIILNPLGVPSRMNVGQILEAHLGWASRVIGNRIGDMLEQANTDGIRKIIKKVYSSPVVDDMVKSADEDELKAVAKRLAHGIHISSPVFDGATEAEIRNHFDVAGLDNGGQTILFDGRSGEPFDNEVTVGVMYLLKLHHLVEEKIHARSIGPYSLVSQQPLGGKAQFGGQRLGEMEVWAIEAYGAAYTLQEFLTVKSDDVAGRTRMYESIVKGENVLEPGLPESFNVLVKELQSLALNVELVENQEQQL